MSGSARIPDGYIVRAQDRAAARWRMSCASDDALRRRIEVQLSEGRLPAVHGISKSHRGTGRLCIVCRRAVGPTEVEREVAGSSGAILTAHEACYKPWLEESRAWRDLVAVGESADRSGRTDGDRT
jgi:hypothetical protein